MQQILAPEKLLATVPILAATLAVCFDVGYFWSIDINFFNAFGLAEHIVFALQALPYAITILALMGAITACFIRFMDALEERRKRKSIAQGERLEKTSHLKRTLLFYAVLILAASLQIYYGGHFAVLMTFAILFSIVSIDAAPSYLKKYLSVLTIAVFGMSFSFSLGTLFGDSGDIVTQEWE